MSWQLQAWFRVWGLGFREVGLMYYTQSHILYLLKVNYNLCCFCFCFRLLHLLLLILLSRLLFVPAIRNATPNAPSAAARVKLEDLRRISRKRC